MFLMVVLVNVENGFSVGCVVVSSDSLFWNDGLFSVFSRVLFMLLDMLIVWFLNEMLFLFIVMFRKSGMFCWFVFVLLL